MLARYMDVFIYREINKKLGISFDDFLNRPRYEIEQIVEIITEVDKKRFKDTEAALKEHGSILKGTTDLGKD